MDNLIQLEKNLQKLEDLPLLFTKKRFIINLSDNIMVEIEDITRLVELEDDILVELDREEGLEYIARRKIEFDEEIRKCIEEVKKERKTNTSLQNKK